MKPEPDEFLPTRRSLLSRLKDWDDSESWRDFFNTYSRLIYGVARQSGLADAEAQDVVQETVLSVAKQLPRFRYDPAAGSFKGWLRLITQRRIADHLRRHYRRPGAAPPAAGRASGTSLLERIPDPAAPDLEIIWDREWERHRLAAALRRVKRQVEARQFQIFDCHVLKEWPVKEVVKTFGVTAGQVYLIKHRVAALLEQALARVDANAG